MTASLPRPLLFDGSVSVDAHERELMVRPAGSVRPLAKVLWDETVRTMAQELKTSRRQSAPTPWASGAGHDRIAQGIPSDDGTMRFRFHPGHPDYKTLVSTRGLMARIALDRSNGRISVTFRGRR